MQSIAEPAHSSHRPALASAFVGVLPLLLLVAEIYLESVIPRGNQVGGFLFPPETPGEYLAVAPWLVFSLAMVVGFAVGWLRRFPRWSYSYVGLLVLVALGAASAPGSRELGIYGAIAWVPAVAIGASIALLAITSWRKLGSLPGGIAADWTRPSFAMLCLLTPLYVGLIHDAPGIVVWGVFAIVVIGAFGYLLTRTVRAGALALLSTVLLIAAIPQVWLWWVQRDNPYSTVGSLLISVLLFVGVLIALVFWPALIGLVRRGRGGRVSGGGDKGDGTVMG
jgi:hypothetical protein